MRKGTAIYLCGVFSLFLVAGVSGCGASGSGGCGGSSRAFLKSDLTATAGTHRGQVLPMPLVQEANFQFSERSGTARYFKATTDFGAYPTAIRTVADESDTSANPLFLPGETIAIGTSGTPCGPEPDWYMTMEVFEGRAVAHRRLQAGHSYTLVSDESTREEYAKFRVYAKEADEFVAVSGSIIVEAVDEKGVTLDFKDLRFQQVGKNGKPNTAGSFKLSGSIRLEAMQ